LRAARTSTTLCACRRTLPFVSSGRLADTITDPPRAEEFVSKDSAYYLEMAEGF